MSNPTYTAGKCLGTDQHGVVAVSSASSSELDRLAGVKCIIQETINHTVLFI